MKPEPRMLEGIADAIVVEQRWNEDDRGALCEIWRRSWARATSTAAEPEIGQVYLSETRPNVVKAWHHHLVQTDRFVVVYGTVRLVLYDDREGSPTYGNIVEIVLSADRYRATVTIPPGVVHGWKNVGDVVSGVLNVVSHEYDGTDEFRRGAHEGPASGVPYDWNARVDG